MRILVLCGLAAMLTACASGRGDDSEREWQRAECNRVLDDEARARCMKRIEADYGTRKGEEAGGKKR